MTEPRMKNRQLRSCVVTLQGRTVPPSSRRRGCRPHHPRHPGRASAACSLIRTSVVIKKYYLTDIHDSIYWKVLVTCSILIEHQVPFESYGKRQLRDDRLYSVVKVCEMSPPKLLRDQSHFIGSLITSKVERLRLCLARSRPSDLQFIIVRRRPPSTACAGRRVDHGAIDLGASNPFS